jgi:multidrug efflux system membrane fusion protein
MPLLATMAAMFTALKPSRRKRSPSRSARPLLLLVVALLAGGCDKPPQPTSTDDRPLVHVIEPEVRDVTEYVTFTGRTDAVESVEIRARVTGYLVEVDFQSGSDAKKGQRLFKIDPRPYQAEFDRLNAQTKLAEARYRLAVADYHRGLEIAKTPGAISQQDLDNYAAKRDQAESEIAAAKAAAESASLNLEFTNVASPIDGVVGRNLLTVGNLVHQDTSLLTTVVSEDPMYGYFDVDENTMLRVRRMMREGRFQGTTQGGHVKVELGLADEDERYPHVGEVDFVNNRVAASTGTLQVRGVFPNERPGPMAPRLLRPGMFVRIRLPMGEPHPAMLLPESAISTDQGAKFVLVVNDKNAVEFRPITLGARQPGGWQVVEPVKIVRDAQGIRRARGEETGTDSLVAGEKVIVTGLQRVRPGIEVRTKPYELSPGALVDR